MVSFLHLNSFRQFLLHPGSLVLWRSWPLSGNPEWSDVPPLSGFCHPLPVLLMLIEKVLTILEYWGQNSLSHLGPSWCHPEKMLSYWCSSAVVITKLHLILSWLVLSCIWFGVLCVLVFQLYSFLPCIFYLTCHISYIITSYFGPRTSSWAY